MVDFELMGDVPSPPLSPMAPSPPHSPPTNLPPPLSTSPPPSYASLYEDNSNLPNYSEAIDGEATAAALATLDDVIYNLEQELNDLRPFSSPLLPPAEDEDINEGGAEVTTVGGAVVESPLSANLHGYVDTNMGGGGLATVGGAESTTVGGSEVDSLPPANLHGYEDTNMGGGGSATVGGAESTTVGGAEVDSLPPAKLHVCVHGWNPAVDDIFLEEGFPYCGICYEDGFVTGASEPESVSAHVAQNEPSVSGQGDPGNGREQSLRGSGREGGAIPKSNINRRDAFRRPADQLPVPPSFPLRRTKGVDDLPTALVRPTVRSATEVGRGRVVDASHGSSRGGSSSHAGILLPQLNDVSFPAMGSFCYACDRGLRAER